MWIYSAGTIMKYLGCPLEIATTLECWLAPLYSRFCMRTITSMALMWVTDVCMVQLCRSNTHYPLPRTAELFVSYGNCNFHALRRKLQTNVKY